MAKPSNTDTKKSTTLDIVALQNEKITAYILGTTPLFMNRMAEKARQTLLLPGLKMTAAEKAHNLKHDVLYEYRSSMYQIRRELNPPTRLHIPSPMFANAIASAGLEFPGATKAGLSRLTTVSSTQIYLYGVPHLSMAVVRNSYQSRTPDIRTRAVVPEWACQIEISYIKGKLTSTTIGNLIAGAGMLIGIGDGRKEKGHGLNYGSFRLVAPDNEDYLRILGTGDRAAQDNAIADPAFFDEDSEDLFSWYTAALEAREKTGQTRKHVVEPEEEVMVQ
jgi:hypothetical protein